MTPSTTSPFGLIAQLAKTRIHLPLTHIESRFQIMGDLASVQMDQVFEQTAREALDVTYTFPLPGGAAVHRCEMIVNGRTIRAVVMEEGEARRTVKQKKAAGHRTALVEMDRDNLFTLQLGNVMPGDRILIRFAYIERLDRLGMQLSLRIPFSPGVRYIPGKPLLRANRGLGTVDDTDQVPDASRLSPPRISGDHPDAATMYLHGTLDDREVDLRTLSSPTHPAILRSIAGQIDVELAGEEHLPDHDFVLRWEESLTAEPLAKSWATIHDGHTYALLQIRAPQTVAARDDLAQDIYFLLDRSGSMAGGNWEMCAVALHAFVRELGPHDRVWITCFESKFQDFSDLPMPRAEILADEGFLHLADIGVAGGTDLLPALGHVLGKCRAFSQERPARIIVITDGQVGNESEILNLMRQPQHAGLPVHCFGIDRAVNDAFLKSLARQTGGRCALMTPDDDIPAAVQRLAETLRRPVLTQLVVQGDVMTTNDRPQLADLHASEVTTVAIRGVETLDQVMIHGRHADGSEWTQRFNLQPDAEQPAARLQWARQRCDHYLASGKNAKAIELASLHNLVCQGTSFVAWDEVEKVSVAKREVYQPSLEVNYSMAPPPLQSPSRGSSKVKSMAAPARPGRQTNFFEGRVTDDQKASTLHECSVDELLADTPDLADDDDHMLCQAAEITTTCFKMSAPRTDGINEEFQRLGIHPHFRILYSQVSDTAPADLPAWALQLRDSLTSEGIHSQAASLLVSILLQWAGEIIGQQRHNRVLALVMHMNSSTSPLEELHHFLKTLATEPAVEDALLVLEAVLEKNKLPIHTP